LCVAGLDDCYRYQTLNDRTRAASVHRGNVLRCDQKDFPYTRWYRFTGASGTQMPTKCVPEHRCGTHAPGWLSSSHPTRVGQIVNGKVCFKWSGNCCRWSATIQIKMCNGYYIYKLPKTPCCWLRYCGNAGYGKPLVFLNPLFAMFTFRFTSIARYSYTGYNHIGKNETMSKKEA